MTYCEIIGSLNDTVTTAVVQVQSVYDSRSLGTRRQAAIVYLKVFIEVRTGKSRGKPRQ